MSAPTRAVADDGPGRRPRRRRLVLRLVPVAAALAAVALAAAGVIEIARSGSPLPGAGGGPAVSGEEPDTRRAVLELTAAQRTAPLEFSGTSLAGAPLDITDHRGQVVVVNVWGSWCLPCQAEAPVLARAAAQYADQGVAFMGIDVKDQRSAALAFERRYGIGYPSLDDPSARTLLAFNGSIPPAAVPSTLVLDRQGRLAARVVGQVGAGTLTALLDRVLSEPASSTSTPGASPAQPPS